MSTSSRVKVASYWHSTNEDRRDQQKAHEATQYTIPDFIYISLMAQLAVIPIYWPSLPTQSTSSAGLGATTASCGCCSTGMSVGNELNPGRANLRMIFFGPLGSRAAMAGDEDGMEIGGEVETAEIMGRVAPCDDMDASGTAVVDVDLTGDEPESTIGGEGAVVCVDTTAAGEGEDSRSDRRRVGGSGLEERDAGSLSPLISLVFDPPACDSTVLLAFLLAVPAAAFLVAADAARGLLLVLLTSSFSGLAIKLRSRNVLPPAGKAEEPFATGSGGGRGGVGNRGEVSMEARISTARASQLSEVSLERSVDEEGVKVGVEASFEERVCLLGAGFVAFSNCEG